ncbi:hypothetical protein OG21DRAFT_1324865 [Imleria badia]|nr:hypothetical protein OG21DRAFT_1324865 [Imleria badia]
MHRAFYVEEILIDIFGHCDEVDTNVWPKGSKGLSALARTCKTFKEPALDILWSKLTNLSPLVRCLPEASFLTCTDRNYSLKRPLKQADWDIILGFTRRVRVCHLLDSCGLTADCVQELSNPPTSTASIFPKLFELAIWRPKEEIIPFLQHLTGPRLTVLKLEYPHALGDAIGTFGERCPNVATFGYACIPVKEEPDTISGLICQWSKLRFIRCKNALSLNAAARTHLSFDLFGPSSILTFQALVQCELHSRSLAAIRRFLDPCRLSMIEQLDVGVIVPPTGLELQSFLATLPDVCNHDSLIVISTWVSGFEFGLPYAAFAQHVPPYHINFHHLCPLTVFANVQTIDLSIPCGADLSERELLQLASSWPRLQVFIVGGNEGCTSSSTITLRGFVQLLERCRLLSRFSFTFDTRGYTEISQGHPWHGFGMPEDTEIRVRDSAIEEESVEALAIFFHVAPFPKFSLVFGSEYPNGERRLEPFTLYRDRWKRVHSLAQKLWEERDKLLHS